MATLKNNWLRAGITLTVLLFSAFIIVNAMINKSKVQLSKTASPQEWAFQPVGSSTDMNDQNNYVPYDPLIHTDCGGTSNQLCTITAEEDGTTNKPLLNPSKPVTLTESYYSPTRKDI